MREKEENDVVGNCHITHLNRPSHSPPGPLGTGLPAASQAGPGQSTAGRRRKAGPQSLPAFFSCRSCFSSKNTFPGRKTGCPQQHRGPGFSCVHSQRSSSCYESGFRLTLLTVPGCCKNPIDWIGPAQGYNLKCAPGSNVRGMRLTKVGGNLRELPKSFVFS